MSVGVFRFKNDEFSLESEQIFFASVSSERFYTNIWERALYDTGAKLFKDGSQFTTEQAEEVLAELQRVVDWCKEHLTDKQEIAYMKNRLDYLIKSISKEAKHGHEKFFIF